ncbi:IS3 family transposase [Gammaproteobacteria bacterium]|nr:IS3 family transposase [Gammaproteobacteria bacterium]
MTKKKGKPSRIRHSDEYKQEVLKLASQVGVAQAARDMGLYASPIYGWRQKVDRERSVSDRERTLATENARLRRQLHESQEAVAILKKGQRVLRQRAQVKYTFIEFHRVQHPVRALCAHLQVSPSGYYDWHRRRNRRSSRVQRRDDIDASVNAEFQASKGRYGEPRISAALSKQGKSLNRKTVARSLKRQGLVCKKARRFKQTTRRDARQAASANHLDQDFQASAPNQKWAGDITYINTREGWLYLAVILDLYSRKVIGRSMSDRITSQLACDALTMSQFRRKQPQGVIVHGDRGSQYGSAAYQQRLSDHGLVGSMSGAGNCYDNAAGESFFDSLKVELVDDERYPTREQAKRSIFEYIEVDYNQTRLHSTNGYLTPVDFEAKHVA